MVTNADTHSAAGIANPLGRPGSDEYAPFYAGYVAGVPEGQLLMLLRDQLAETEALLREFTGARADFRYAPDKWSVKEVVGHMADAERIFAYRALRFARNDRTPLPGYEQDDYIPNASFDSFPLGDLAAEFQSVRRATLFLFRHLDAGAWARRGVASESEVSVRALAYIIAGHELHHVGILRDRYLSAPS